MGLPSILLMCLSVLFLNIPGALSLNYWQPDSFKVPHFFQFLFSRICILLYKLGVFLQPFTIISELKLFISLSIRIAKYRRKVTILASVLSSGWCIYHFFQSNIPRRPDSKWSIDLVFFFFC